VVASMGTSRLCRPLTQETLGRNASIHVGEFDLLRIWWQA